MLLSKGFKNMAPIRWFSTTHSLHPIKSPYRKQQTSLENKYRCEPLTCSSWRSTKLVLTLFTQSLASGKTKQNLKIFQRKCVMRLGCMYHFKLLVCSLFDLLHLYYRLETSTQILQQILKYAVTQP